jgi:RNA polymerase sigma-70 factor (ECF subfamily)
MKTSVLWVKKLRLLALTRGGVAQGSKGFEMVAFHMGKVPGQNGLGPQAGGRFRRADIARGRHDPRERQAIACAKNGDWDGLHYLYARYADDVCRYVESIVRDHHEAEDITQTVFTRLMTAIRKYEEQAVPFTAWIMRVARNATLDYMRTRRQVPVEDVRASEGDETEFNFDRRECLKEALAGLPAEQRKVLVLRHVVGLSPREIAKRLGKTESSVQGLHHRGRASLKAALRELESAPVTTSP